MRNNGALKSPGRGRLESQRGRLTVSLDSRVGSHVLPAWIITSRHHRRGTVPASLWSLFQLGVLGKNSSKTSASVFFSCDLKARLKSVVGTGGYVWSRGPFVLLEWQKTSGIRGSRFWPYSRNRWLSQTASLPPSSIHSSPDCPSHFRKDDSREILCFRFSALNKPRSELFSIVSPGELETIWGLLPASHSVHPCLPSPGYNTPPRHFINEF